MSKNLRDYSYTETIVRKPADVYSVGALDRLEKATGYVVVAFRVPTEEDSFWSNTGSGVLEGMNLSDVLGEPRFILRHKTAPVVVKPYTSSAVTVEEVYGCGPEGITLPEGCEYVGFRKPRHNETILTTSKSTGVLKDIYKVTRPEDWSDPRIIVRKVGEA